MAYLTSEQFKSIDTDPVEGETLYDVDGNAYTVRDGRAELNLNDQISTDLSTPAQRDCFSRTNPKG